MTSRYRVEYALKSHRRDEFIEWIKGLLATPFVLHADVQNHTAEIHHCHTLEDYESKLEEGASSIAMECLKRYYEIFNDVEKLVEHTILIDKLNEGKRHGLEPLTVTRLRQLVPLIGRFFTHLPLKEAFLIEDVRRSILKRRLVSPSFNDVRMILNTAQILALSKLYNDPKESSKLKLITFDGDVTLYDDGKLLEELDPVVDRLLKLLERDLFVAVVTAAGYPGQQGAQQYYARLKGLVDAINKSKTLTFKQKANLLVMGGESNYLFRFDPSLGEFRFIDSDEWYLPVMQCWNKIKIQYVMDAMYLHLKYLQRVFNLENNTSLILKERSVGIIPDPGFKILREFLEEMVLLCSLKLNEVLIKIKEPYFVESYLQTKGMTLKEGDISPHEQDINVCAFNGGSDVWVDIGDKALGVESLQKYLCQDEELHHLCPIQKSESLHIGDQFASLGANDFKARLSACTVWIASPLETVAVLDDLLGQIVKKEL